MRLQNFRRIVRKVVAPLPLAEESCYWAPPATEEVHQSAQASTVVLVPALGPMVGAMHEAQEDKD